jgi:ATP-dependent RNA helicase RhlE
LTSFADFGLAEPITRALAQENYQTPTPIQKDAVPFVLAGRDLVGIAQTGTGKTAAFALPILNRLAATPRPLEKKSCRVLVLSPTRELSGQILDSFRTYGRHLRVSSTLAIGGVSMGGQVRALMHGVDVLVATPGRLLDLVRSNALRLGQVEVLVLDEADRMLDMGFIHDIRQIVAKLPQQRQTLLFSATMPREIAELAQTMLRDPARVAVTPAASTVERIAQRVIHTDRAAKPGLLVDVLKSEPIERVLVFTRTKHGADKVVRGLEKSGIAAAALHGNKSQNQRERVMAQFRAGSVRTLVATDIAARGIDVDGISHVINYDLPNIPESYVHRIGRTARAGAEGVAISFCDAEEAAFLRDIEKLIRLKIPSNRADTRPTNGSAHPRNAERPAHRSKSQRPESRRSESQRPESQRPQSHGAESHRSEPRRSESQRPEQAQPAETRKANGQRRRKRRGGGGGNRPVNERPDNHPVSRGTIGNEIQGVAFLQRPSGRNGVQHQNGPVRYR